MSNIVVKLEKPLEANGKVYEELEIREPTVGDLEDAQMASPKSETGMMRQLVGLLTDIPPANIRKMFVKDWAKVQKAVTPFFADFL